MSSTRCTVFLPWKLANAGLFQFSILLQACNAPSHTSQLHLGSTCLLIHQGSRYQASTSLQTQKRFRLAVFNGCPGCKHQATHPEKNCSGVLFMCIRSPLLCHTENDASEICHTLRAMVSSSSIPQPSISGNVRRGASLTCSAAQLATDCHLMQLFIIPTCPCSSFLDNQASC